jgi:beta,beta-carotene 9',10'-dioxygenase
MSSVEFAIGFATQSTEVEDVELPVVGSLPDWMNGTLIRNGPSVWDLSGNRVMQHWFDGFAMLHRFKFGGGRLRYSSKMLRSNAFEHSQNSGRLRSSEFATKPNPSILQRLMSMVRVELTDNANANVAKIGESYVAMTETSRLKEFDLQDLTTRGDFHFDTEIAGQITTAHPQFDPHTGTMYNVIVNTGKKSEYVVFKVKAGSKRREVVARIPVLEPAYIHSFALTEHYVILVEYPLRFKPLDLLLSGKPYCENYKWHEDLPTIFLVIDKKTGEVTECECEAMFSFHHVNAFERKGEIFVDAAVYPNAGIINQLYLKDLFSGHTPMHASLRRFRLGVGDAVTHEALSRTLLEFPQINQVCNGMKYRFVYGAAATGPDQFLNRLVKINTVSGATLDWNQAHCYPGEPVFVLQPGSDREDGGVLVSVVLDTAAKQSFLQILDAGTMKPICRADLPAIVPFGFHGHFFEG